MYTRLTKRQIQAAELEPPCSRGRIGFQEGQEIIALPMGMDETAFVFPLQRPLEEPDGSVYTP